MVEIKTVLTGAIIAYGRRSTVFRIIFGGGGRSACPYVNPIDTLRFSPEGELEGLDLHEHGAVAYPAQANSSIS